MQPFPPGSLQYDSSQYQHNGHIQQQPLVYDQATIELLRQMVPGLPPVLPVHVPGLPAPPVLPAPNPRPDSMIPVGGQDDQKLLIWAVEKSVRLDDQPCKHSQWMRFGLLNTPELTQQYWVKMEKQDGQAAVNYYHKLKTKLKVLKRKEEAIALKKDKVESKKRKVQGDQAKRDKYDASQLQLLRAIPKVLSICLTLVLFYLSVSLTLTHTTHTQTHTPLPPCFATFVLFCLSLSRTHNAHTNTYTFTSFV